MSKNDGGPAFPVLEGMESSLTSAPDYSVRSDGGMTLRDYFAGQALAGLMASPNRHSAFLHPDDAAFCYASADAMLTEREKEK